MNGVMTDKILESRGKMMGKTIGQKRLFYVIVTGLLLLVEVLIALFVRDNFIRPYVGDMLVVILIYCLLRILIPERVRLLPLYVFLFAVGVELLQAVDIVHLLGLGENSFFQILIGSTFDVKDIACYVIGCALTGIYEYVIWKRREYNI